MGKTKDRINKLEKELYKGFPKRDIHGWEYFGASGDGPFCWGMTLGKGKKKITAVLATSFECPGYTLSLDKKGSYASIIINSQLSISDKKTHDFFQLRIVNFPGMEIDDNSDTFDVNDYLEHMKPLLKVMKETVKMVHSIG